VLEALRNRVARWLSGGQAQPPTSQVIKVGGQQRYASGFKSRLRAGWATPNASANAMLETNLKQMRNSARALMRDASYAKRAADIIVNNVVGTGIGVQAKVRSTREGLRDNVNEAIETAWAEWCKPENCTVGGELHFNDLERLLLREVVEAGEIFVKAHLRPFGDSAVPLALEVIEPERIADEYSRVANTAAGNVVVMGVELDRYHRPQAYWVRDHHPGDHRLLAGTPDTVQREPATLMFHLRVFKRHPQTRGEPWLHTAINKLHDMDEYSEAEVTAASSSAKIFGSIKKNPDLADPNPAGPSGTSTDASGARQFSIENGVMYDLDPGEEIEMHAPNRPNTALDPFLRYMVREVAAGIGVSYASMSGDYSQTNYSSSRLGLLDDRDAWKVLQQWWVRTFRARLHALWLRQAIYSRAIEVVRVNEYVADPAKFEVVRWKLRGWTWVDPAKEVSAYKEAVKAGFTTVTKVIDQTADGSDLEDILEQREAELKAFAEHGITVDTTVIEAKPPAPAAAPPAPPDDDAEDDADEDQQEQENEPPARLVSFRR